MLPLKGRREGGTERERGISWVSDGRCSESSHVSRAGPPVPGTHQHSEAGVFGRFCCHPAMCAASLDPLVSGRAWLFFLPSLCLQVGKPTSLSLSPPPSPSSACTGETQREGLPSQSWTGREASLSLSFPTWAAVKRRVLWIFPPWNGVGVGTPKAPMPHLLPNPGVQGGPER